MASTVTEAFRRLGRRIRLPFTDRLTYRERIVLCVLAGLFLLSAVTISIVGFGAATCGRPASAAFASAKHSQVGHKPVRDERQVAADASAVSGARADVDAAQSVADEAADAESKVSDAQDAVDAAQSSVDFDQQMVQTDLAEGFDATADQASLAADQQQLDAAKSELSTAEAELAAVQKNATDVTDVSDAQAKLSDAKDAATSDELAYEVALGLWQHDSIYVQARNYANSTDAADCHSYGRSHLIIASVALLLGLIALLVAAGEWWYRRSTPETWTPE